LVELDELKQKLATMSGVFSEARFVVINRLIVPASTLLLLIWIGRHSDVLLGQYALATTFYFVLQTLPSLGLSHWLLREVAREPADAGKLFGTVGALAIVACGLINAVLHLWIPKSAYSNDLQQAVLVVGLTIAPGILAFLSELVLISLRVARWVAYTAFAENALRLIASMWVLQNGGGVVALIWVLLITRVLALCSYIMAGWTFGANFRPRFAWSVLRNIRGVLPTFFAGTLLALVVSRMDYFVLAYFRNESYIGYYAISYRLLEIAQMALTAVLTALFPRMSRLFVKEPQRFRTVASSGLLVTFAICIFIAFIGVLWADRYVAWLFTNQYPHPVVLAQGFVALIGVMGLDMYIAGLLNASDRQIDDLRAQTAGALVYAGLLLILIPLWGGMGALFAMGVAIAIQLLVRLVSYRRRVGNLHYRSPWTCLVGMAVFMLALAIWGPKQGDWISLLVVTGLGSALYGLGLVAIILGNFGSILLNNWPACTLEQVRTQDSLHGFLDHVRADLKAYCRWRVKALRHNATTPAKPNPTNWAVPAVMLHRLSRWAWLKGNERLARILYEFNLILTNAKLPPWAQIGPGLVLTHTCGITVVGSLGPKSLLGALSADGRSGIAGTRVEPELPVLQRQSHPKHWVAIQGHDRLQTTTTQERHVDQIKVPFETTHAPWSAGTRMNWSECACLIRSDLHRLQQAIYTGKEPAIMRFWSLLLMPEAACLALYRVGHFALRRGWFNFAVFLYRTSITMTGADINPESQIGPSCLIVHPVGIVLFGRLGARLSVFPRAIVAADIMRATLEDAPVIGDDVVLGEMSSVIGDVTIANAVCVTLCSAVDSSAVTTGVKVR
jgi:O-antigen/teichoic acid export membrane protein/serine acetyltransferase